MERPRPRRRWPVFEPLPPVGPGYEDPHARALGRICIAQPLVEEGKLEHVDLVFRLGPEIDVAERGHPWHVVPGPDDQARVGGARPAADSVVVGHRALEKDVIQAADRQRRHVDRGQHFGHVPTLPVVVLGLVRQPVGEEPARRARREVGYRRQRQPPVVVIDLCVLCREPRFQVGVAAAGHVVREKCRPGSIEGERKRAVVVRPTLVEVGAGHRRDHASQALRLADRDLQLRVPGVGEAVHPDLAVREGQRAQPRHGVLAVVRLRLERDELATRRPPSADVLRHDGVATARVPRRVRVAEVLALVFVIGQPDQEHRMLSAT